MSVVIFDFVRYPEVGDAFSTDVLLHTNECMCLDQRQRFGSILAETKLQALDHGVGGFL